MIKKIISVLSAISMLATMAVVPAFAAEDSNYVTYEYPLNANEIRNDTNPSKSWGITPVMQNKVTNSMWGPIASSSAEAGKIDDTTSDWNKFSAWGWDQDRLTSLRYVLKSGSDTRRPSVRVSQRSVQNGELLNLDFTKDTYHTSTGFTFSSDKNYLIDFDFGAVLRSGTFSLEFVNENNEAFSTLNLTYNNSSTAYKAAMKNSSKSITLPQNDASVTAIANLKLFVDMKNQKYSAWLVKAADSSVKYGTVSHSIGTLLVDNAPFETATTKMTKLRVSRSNSTTPDRVDLFRLAVNDLSDNTIADTALNSISIPAVGTTDLTLPTSKTGADIVWSSSNTDIVSDDGKVTPDTAESKTVILTATAAYGTAQMQKKFTYRVPAYPVSVPSDEIWVNDEMAYNSVADIPSINDQTYGFSFDNTCIPGTDTNQNVGGVYYTDGSSITMLKAANTSQAGAFYKYLAPSNEQQYNGKQVIEYSLNIIGTPVVYTAVELYNNWKGIMTLQLPKDQVFAPSNTSYSPSGSITGVNMENTKQMNVCLVTDAQTKTMDIYLNGKKQWSNVMYRSKWSSTGDGADKFGKIQFSVSKDSPKASGIKLNYVRVAETLDDYASFCLTHENTTIPTELAAEAASVSLPSVGKYNNTISWSTSDPSVISADGTVSHFASDKTVTLTPTYTNVVTGALKEGTPVDVTVKARAAAETAGTTEMITPETGENESQRAVGYLGTATPKNEGFAPVVGFKLSYPGKTDKIVTFGDIPNVESNIRFGVIITYTDEDNFDINSLSVTSFIKD